MKKRVTAAVLCVALSISLLAGCRDSSKETNIKDVKETGFDVNDEVSKFKMGDLNDTEKNYTIQMGYYNCDHMCASLIGKYAGIYDALGLNVNITKSAETIKALSSGQMDVGYIGIEGAIRAANNGAAFTMAAANHLGGSRYLVASNDITDASQLVGKNIAISTDADYNPEWLTWCQKLGIPSDVSQYNVVEMGQQDAMFALKAGQISAFSCCDPYASTSIYQGFGHVLATGWGAANVNAETNQDDWGLCCIYAISNQFKESCPELARRLVFAHELAIKYIYTHPYNAAMMFAEGFDVDPAVGLRTIYMKTVAEGRTLTWHFSQSNIESDHKYYTQFPEIPESEIPSLDNYETFVSTDLGESAGLEDFQAFISDSVDSSFPIGMSMSDWYAKAKEVDSISDSDAPDISVFVKEDESQASAR